MLPQDARLRSLAARAALLVLLGASLAAPPAAAAPAAGGEGDDVFRVASGPAAAPATSGYAVDLEEACARGEIVLRFEDPSGVRGVALPFPQMPLDGAAFRLGTAGGGRVTLVSRDLEGKVVGRVTLAAASPAVSEVAGCGFTEQVRFALEPAITPPEGGRELAVVPGGTLEATAGAKRQRWRLVGATLPGDAALEPRGGTVRVHLLYDGAPPADRVREALRARIARELDRTWGRCGFGFSVEEGVEVRAQEVGGPLLIVGCGGGLPAREGEIALTVAGAPLVVPVGDGWAPRRVARALEAALVARGLSVRRHEHVRAGATALPEVDLVVRDRSGAMVPMEFTAGAAPTPGVCLVEPDTAVGIRHFSDANSPVGTPEERALLVPVMSDTPAVIDFVLIPSFASGGRVGESFIRADGSVVRNAVLLSFAGVVLAGQSAVSAHELGHIYLDQPGHPDDYDRDTPSLLMDSDASDASWFGPRRLTTEECARAAVQSGEGAPWPLLVPLPPPADVPFAPVDAPAAPVGDKN